MDTNQVRDLTDRIDAVLGGYDTIDDVDEARARVTIECLRHRLGLALMDMELPVPAVVREEHGDPHLVFDGGLRTFDKFVCAIEDLRDLRKGQ